MSKHNEALELLHKSVTELISSDSWREALAFRKNFHNYSFSNVWMIYAQKPDATQVAGYRKWQELGRQVRKGEKSIAILAPLLVRDKDSGDPKARRLVGFRTARVFDISQTEGDEVPQLPSPVELTDEHPLTAELMGKFKAYCESNGHALSWEDLTDGSLGYFVPSSKSIVLKTGLAPLQELKTLVHEIAHAAFDHGGGDDRATAELEAETCAYLVLHDLGVDTSSYSFTYLGHWAGEPKALIAAGDRASKMADSIVDYVMDNT